MPSIASFLKISIPKEALMEIDGIPLTGKLSASHAEATFDKGMIKLKWKVQDKPGKAKIWMATTNNFKSGMKDEYQLVKEVPVANGKATIDVSKNRSEFYKIVLEMPHNFLNRWIIVKE
jgi:hypothetical protein